MKRTVLLLMVMSMVFCLFSCGGTVAETEQASSPATTDQSDPDPENANRNYLSEDSSNIGSFYIRKGASFSAYSPFPQYALTTVTALNRANVPLNFNPVISPITPEYHFVALGNGLYEWEQETKSDPDEQAPPYDEAMVEAAADCLFYNHRISTEHTPFCLDDVKRIIKEETVERKLGKDTMARILAKIKFYHPIILNVAREDADLPKSLIINGHEEDLCCFKVLFSDGSFTHDSYFNEYKNSMQFKYDLNDYSTREMSDQDTLNISEKEKEFVPDYSAASDGFVISKVIRSEMVNVPAATETVLSETGTVCFSYNGEVLLMIR